MFSFTSTLCLQALKNKDYIKINDLAESFHMARRRAQALGQVRYGLPTNFSSLQKSRSF